MPRRTSITSVVLLLQVLIAPPTPADPAESDLDRAFTQTIRPFLNAYCTNCHGGQKPRPNSTSRRTPRSKPSFATTLTGPSSSKS
jgi:hypothetical protein